MLSLSQAKGHPADSRSARDVPASECIASVQRLRQYAAFMASMDPAEVDAKLSFAQQRMTELLRLNAGDIAGASADDRDRLTAEFFSHLVSATEVLAQYVNENKALGLAAHRVSVAKVADTLGAASGLGSALHALYVNIGKAPFPADPYSDAGLVHRILLYRNHTTHHRRAPFTFSVPARKAHFNLDPTNLAAGMSRDSIDVELPRMLDVIVRRCRSVLALL